MFKYLVSSSALFCAALQAHWPKVTVRIEHVEKKRSSFLQRSRESWRLPQNSLIQKYNLVRATCDLIRRDPAANQLARERASSAANERPCTRILN